jgi:repressor LexA
MKQFLTRRQQDIYDYLAARQERLERPPTLDDLCRALGLRSRGSLHKHVQALVKAGLVEPLGGRHRGIRLAEQNHSPSPEPQQDTLPYLGQIAAGRPIEAVEVPDRVPVPGFLRTQQSCYVLQVKGDSMVEDGILDGDWVVVEQRNHARNGEIVVALIDGWDATLKRIEQRPGQVTLHPANSAMPPMTYSWERVQIQGVLVGQMRRYR